MTTRATVALAATAALAPAAALAGGADPLTPRTKVGPQGAGAVRIGMTLVEAQRATGQQFASLGEPQKGTDCSYAVARRGPRELSFMLKGKRIVRVDVGPRSPVRTTRGVGAGATEAAVRRAYPRGLRTERHHYLPRGHYLVFTPAARELRNRRVIFETDGRKVTAIRAGRVPEVRFVEGCS
jgi:hypothetical protein